MVTKRQEKEREFRKKQILDGALTVFHENGLNGTTMDEIARVSDFGKATLYYYFRSKEEVFSSILDRGWTALWKSLEDDFLSDKNPRESFIKILTILAQKTQNNRNEYEFLFNAPKTIMSLEEKKPIWKSYQQRLYTSLKELLEKGIALGQFPQLDSDLMFKAIGGLFVGLIFMGEQNKNITSDDIETLLNQLIADPNQS